MAKLIWTENALAQLAEIDGFLAKSSPPAATEVIEGIVNKVELIANHPRAGAQVLDIGPREVREVLYGHYRIFYEYVDSTDVANLLAVIHSAMDIDRWQIDSGHSA